jgi:ribosomal-protein-alanine N-acetyltransferase
MSAPAAASFSPSDPVHWSEHPDPRILGQLDASCFSPAWSAAECAAWLADPHTLCWTLAAGHPPEPVGWALCRRIGDEAEVLRLGVTPSQRRRGWGQVLLQGILLRLAASGVRQVYLEVREGNAAARALYRRAGFVESGRRKAYYRHPPEDAVLLSLNVEGMAREGDGSSGP